MIQGKVAIITGASSGNWLCNCGGHWQKAGAKVAIGARRTDRLEDLAKKNL